MGILLRGCPFHPYTIKRGGSAIENTQLIISICIYMAGMPLIGYFAYKRTSNLTDYMLGGRSLGPAVTALSAGAPI